MSGHQGRPRPLLTVRFLLLLLGAGGLAFLIGTRVIRTSANPTHPVTGRVIPGMATDAAWMERAARAREEAPDQALALIGVEPGSIVADIGAGTGYMTARLAALVGPTGRVFATEVQPEMVRRLTERTRREGLANVVVVQGTSDDARLPHDSFDLLLLVDAYHEFRQPQAMLRSLRVALKATGRLVIVEFRGEDPAVPIASSHRLLLDTLRAEIEPEGFVQAKVIEALPRQHIVIFKRSSRQAS